MIKKFLFLSIATAALLGAEYESALDKYKAGSHEEAYAEFRELFFLNPANPDINFYLGMSAYESGEYDSAMSAFERVLMVKDSNRARLELAKVYVALGEYERARAELDTVLATEPPKSVQKNIRKLLGAIDRKSQKHFFNFYAALGLGYDTNVNSSPSKSELTDYIANRYGVDEDGVTVDEKLEDSFAEEIAALSHRYDVGAKDGYYIGSSATLYNQNFNDYSDYDVTYFELKTGLNYLSGSYRSGLDVAFDKLIYGDDDLLYSYSLLPSASYIYDGGTVISASLKLQEKHYYYDMTKESRLYGAYIGANRAYGWYTLEGRVGYEQQDARSDDAVFVDKSIYIAQLGSNMQLPLEMMLGAKLRYKYHDFDKSNGIERSDRYSSFNLSLSRDINEEFGVGLGYKYVKNSSDYTPSDYDKSIISLNLSASF